MKLKIKTLLKSQYIQIFLFIILAGVLIFSYLNLDDIIKTIGLPFKIIPHALGITQGVSKDEVVDLEIMADTNLVVVIEQPGYYYIFTSFFYEWSLGPKFEIKTPQGHEIVVSEWLSVARFYDTISARGAPSHRFYIAEPGPYRFYFIPRRDSGFADINDPLGPQSFDTERTSPADKFKISIAPDTITNNESTYRTAYAVQAIILLFLGITFYYFKVARAAVQNKKELNAKRLAKQKQMDAFVNKKSSQK